MGSCELQISGLLESREKIKKFTKDLLERILDPQRCQGLILIFLLGWTIPN